MKRRSHPAFTLVELLVVIAIIGVLMAISLPAVQYVRESSSRVSCSNNLRQIGLAFQHYTTSHRSFPDGGKDWFSPRSMNGPRPHMAPHQNWGWLYQILPFLEQAPLYNETSDAVIQRTPVVTYFCPSRRGPTVVGDNRALNDYAGNGGLIGNGGAVFPFDWWGEGRNGGVIVRGGYVPEVRFKSVTDGGSCTILAGEKALHPRDYHIYSSSDNEGYTSGWDWDVIRWGDRLPCSDPNANGSEIRFGSAHPQGTNFLFVDGSVHHIAYATDLQVFQNAIQRDDGNVTTILE